MKCYFGNKKWRQLLSMLLALTLLFSNLETAALVQAAEADSIISIASAEELAKIGTDSNYPMSGDYVLTADIDLSGSTWTPLGGYLGNKGTCNPEEANVFSGTFDGQGHVISGLSIQLEGSINQSGKYGQVGLFSVIGSDNASDYAEVRNLIFTDVSIRTNFSDGLAAIGTLAGEVNGYATVSNIVVLNGNLTLNPSSACDTVGAGGIIGECRTADTGIGNGNISVTNCYNGADIVASGSRSDLIYAGGIIGRIAKSSCKTIAQCVNTGSIQYDGYDAFGIASAESGNANYLSTISDCYFLDTSGQALGTEATALSRGNLTSGTLPGNLSGESWQAVNGCYPVPIFCYSSSAAGVIYLSGLTLTFAEGETASGVKTRITLPQTIGTDSITWSSSNHTALTIENGEAVAHPSEIGVNTVVMLTAATANGYSRDFKLTVLTDHEQVAAFDQNYAQVGTPLTVSVSNTENLNLTYQWTVDGTTVSNTSTYTPASQDLEKFISVTITETDSGVQWNLTTYCSELPVVYVDTEDGQAVTSNTVAKDADIKVQGNSEFSNSKYLYEGKTTIKGRGNSTWSQAVAWNVKKPYKLKLSSKANLLGLGANGKNKHWVLLANMIDHTNMRNELVNNFARDIGMEYSMGTTSVVLILNGEYQGVYELCEHVRVGSSRVDVFDWEGLADDIADAICAQNAGLDESAMEDAMEQDYSWITSGSFTYQNQTYQIADYYTEEIPEFTGGFLLDMDFRSKSDQYKFISTFDTSNGIAMFFRSPEYAKTSDIMVSYARDYLNAYEAALKSADFTASYNNETVHYTDLFDMDSLIQYWLVCEYTNNWDSMKNSTYLYKDLTGKAKMGPAWDYDWIWGNINMYNMTGPFVYDNWHTTLSGIPMNQGGFCEVEYQKYQWQRYLVKDPYFVAKAYEYYQKYRPTVIEDMIKDGGTIDTLKAKYQTASEANDAKWSYSYNRYSGYAFVNGMQIYTTSQNYDESVASMKTFLNKRVEWMDQQFTSVENLYQSLGNQVSENIAVSVEKGTDGTLTATAEVKNTNAKYVTFLVNGKKVSTDQGTWIPVSDAKAVVTLEDSLLEASEDALNTIEVLGVNASGSYISGEMNFTNFTKASVQTGVPSDPKDPDDSKDPDDPKDPDDSKDPDESKPAALTGTVLVQSNRSGQVSYPGDTLTADVTKSNNSGTLSYQWYADKSVIKGATKASYKLTENEVGKTISVIIQSSAETGKLDGTYAGTVKKKPADKAKKITLSVISKKLQVYQTLQLKVKVTPSTASQKVTYSSSKKSVAAVSKTGKITAKAPGTTVITVTAADGSKVKATCKITVLKPTLKVSGKTVVKLKKSITLTAKASGLKGKITWKLDAKGKKLLKLNKKTGNKVKLTAGKKTGTAKLTITCGKKKVVKTIRIKK